MELINKDDNTPFKNLFLLLTIEEAKEISSRLESLMNDPEHKSIEIPGEGLKGRMTKKIIIRYESKELNYNDK